MLSWRTLSDVSWLLRVSAPAEDHSDADYLGLPPLAANELILCLIWEHIALLHTGSLEDRSDAASSLVSLSRDNDRYTKLIIEERGVGSLLTEGEQVSAAANFTCYRNSTRETMDFFTRAKQVKRIEISDQHSSLVCLSIEPEVMEAWKID
ncbi:hypothetical protein Bca101_083542 [Brassica carinata]